MNKNLTQKIRRYKYLDNNLEKIRYNFIVTSYDTESERDYEEINIKFKSLNYMELNCLEYAVNMSLFEIEKLIRLKPYEIKNYDHLLELYTVLTEQSFSKFVEILKNFKIVRKYEKEEDL